MPDVKVSAVTFADFACTIGPERAAIAAKLRQQYEAPNNQAYAYYRDFDRAWRTGLKDGDLSNRLDRAVSGATGRGQAKHYAELAKGALALTDEQKITELLPVPAGSWRRGDLTLTVTPAFGVALKGGRKEAWFLHHKATPLVQGSADAPLVVLRQMLVDAGSDLEPRVVDVRSGVVWKLKGNRNLRRLDAFVTTEAAAFVRYWELAAAA